MTVSDFGPMGYLFIVPSSPILYILILALFFRSKKTRRLFLWIFAQITALASLSLHVIVMIASYGYFMSGDFMDECVREKGNVVAL